MAFLGDIFNEVGDIFGIGGTGSGQVISKSAAECWGKGAVDCRNSFERTWLPALAGIIGTYGYIRQYELQRDALALQERAIRVAERGIELAERNYNEIAVPVFQRFRDYFDNCVDKMKEYQTRFIEKAFECEEYEADYEGQAGRVKGRISANFDSIRMKVRRSRGKYSTGYVCNEDIRLGIAEGIALSDATNRAYRYEDAKKIRLDQQCFERCQVAASLANSISAQAFNGLNGGASLTQSGLARIQTAQGQLAQAQNNAAQQTSQFADFFGGIANGAFQFVGFSTFQAPQQSGVFGAPQGFGGLNNSGGFLNLSGQGGSGGGLFGQIAGAAGSLGGIISAF